MLRFYRQAAVLAVCISIGGASALQAAETITRKRDKPLSGDVTAVSKTEVSVKVKTPKEDTIKVPANVVQNIAWGGEAPDANLARGDEAGGRYQKAIDGYQKALSAAKGGNPLARVELEYGIARSRGKLALTDPSQAEEAIRRLEEFRTKQGDHYRFYDAVGLLGQLYLAQKDVAKAQAAFELLGKAPWKEAQLASRISMGKLLLADGKPDEAVAAFDAVISQPVDGSQEESQRQEAVLGKARVLIGQKKFDEAQKLLEEVISKADPDDARVHAEAYVRLGDCLREQGKDKDALLAYLHVDVLFATEKSMQAEALFHLTRLWEKVGQKGRAAEARDKLEGEEFKGSEWARQLKAPAAG
jgi:tetratricopeptide (TPR) repeat protein